MVWFVGGPARCGKSTLKRRAQSFASGQILSLDNLKPALHSIVSGNDRDNLLAKIEDTKTTRQEWIELLRRRDRMLWKVTKVFAETLANDSEVSIIEGNVWPDFMAELSPELQYRAVFLVDTSPAHAERIIGIARGGANDNNWMREWTDEHLRHWADYNIARSQEIIRLGKEYNQAVFDIADGGLDAAQDNALNYLRALS